MSDRIQELVDKTFTLSKDYKHQYVTIEHLLAIILDTDEVQDILTEMQIDPKDCSRDVYEHLEKELEAFTDEEVQPKKTVMLERVFHRAFTQALFNGRQNLDTRDLLISILSEETTPATYIMNTRGLDRNNVTKFLTDANQNTDTAFAKGKSKQERILNR